MDIEMQRQVIYLILEIVGGTIYLGKLSNG